MQDHDDLVADATEPIEADGHETTTSAVVIQQPPPAQPALRPQHHGVHEIAGTGMPVVPMGDEIAAMAQLAVTIAGAATAPRALQNNVNDAFMVLLTARDVGVGMTTAVREFHVIDGKVTLSPKVKNAMVKQQGHGRTFPHQAPRPHPTEPDRMLLCPCGSDEPANDDERATWHAERADEPGILHSSTFTMDMARRVRAKENGKAITLAEKSTWQQYPQRMLSWRALGYLLDDVFPEVGTGLYSPDELGAVTDEDGVPVIDVMGQAQPVQGTRAPASHRQRQQAAAEPLASDDERAALKARIDALAGWTGARDALLALWTKPKSDDNPEPTLPKLDALRAKQVKIADAMVASIEQRAAKGEFELVAEPAADESSDATPAPNDDEIVQVVIAEVRAMEPETVNEQLAQRKIDRRGSLDTRRHKLATAMLAERAPHLVDGGDADESSDATGDDDQPGE